MGKLFADQGTRTFSLIWLGELVSAVGSGLTSFALSVWVYRRTGSATLFGLIVMAATAPSVILLPLFGALVDLFDRRRLMILSNAGATLTTLALAALAFTGGLKVWHIFLAVFVRATFVAFLEPAYSATLPLLVPDKHLVRANGMVQSTQAAAQVVSPLLAGLLLVVVGLQGVTLLDSATYLFALFTLCVASLPAAGRHGDGAERKGLPREIWQGWSFIKERAGLVWLLVYFAVFNFFIGIIVVLLPPLVLNFASTTALGTVLSVAGAGFLSGGLVTALWGGPKNRARGIVACGALFSFCVALMGLRPSVPLVAAGAFGMQFFIPIMNGCTQAIWQRKVPVALQGRVFAVRRLIVLSIMPAGYLVAGPLADKVFEPLPRTGGSMWPGLNALAGVGRGIGLLFVVVGLLALLSQLSCYLLTAFKSVEEELPDAPPQVVSAQAQT